MSLPASPDKKFFQKKSLEALILPAVVIVFLVGVLIASVVIPQKKEKRGSSEERNIASYTDRQKVESEGKLIEVTPKVLQISPETLKQLLEAKEDLKLIQVIQKGDEWKEPHIKGTTFMLSSAFDSGANLERSQSHIFISKDGFDSAVAIDKIVNQGYLRESNRNLEGGLEAWKKKGFPLEN
jgi:rhodanese-related sulfurtransferase